MQLSTDKLPEIVTIRSDDLSYCGALSTSVKKEEERELHVAEIRMLLKEKRKSEQEYLVRLSDGKVEVLSSVQLLQTYPLELVGYLEERVHPF